MTGLEVNASFSYPCWNRIDKNRPKTEHQKKNLRRNSRFGQLNTRMTARESKKDSFPFLGLSGVNVAKGEFNTKFPQRDILKGQHVDWIQSPEIIMQDKRYSTDQKPNHDNQREMMNEKNLRLHNEEMRRRSLISHLDRISQWTKSFEPLDIYAIDKVSTDLIESNSPETSRLASPMAHNVTRMIERAQQRSRDNTILPILSQNTEIEIHRQSPSASTQRKGRLLCCLKVEIKSGIYKMLPVYSNDDPFALATNFCRCYNLKSSISNLTEHIWQSKKTYSK